MCIRQHMILLIFQSLETSQWPDCYPFSSIEMELPFMNYPWCSLHLIYYVDHLVFQCSVATKFWNFVFTFILNSFLISCRTTQFIKHFATCYSTLQIFGCLGEEYLYAYMPVFVFDSFLSILSNISLFVLRQCLLTEIYHYKLVRSLIF